MGLSNNEILTRIDTAIKGITDTDTMGQSILQPTKFDQFVRTMQQKTVILPEARYIEMEAQKADIDRIAFSGRVLKSGSDASGDHKNLAESDYSEPGTNTNQLIAKELIAIVSLRDKMLRRNIERQGLEDTIIQLLGEAAGRDMEEWAMLARDNYDTAQDLLLSLTDGWVELAENKLYGVTGGGNTQSFNPDGENYPENMFDAMIQALPKQYIGDRRDWRFYVEFEVEDAYRDLLRSRGTNLGDATQTEYNDLYYKGIQIKYCPMLERSASAGSDGAGSVAMLQNPNNMAWGVFVEVGIEREREAKKRRTDFVLTFEGDAHYEDENASVVAYIDQYQNQVS